MDKLKCAQCGDVESELHYFKKVYYCEQCHPRHVVCCGCGKYFFASMPYTKYCKDTCRPNSYIPKQNIAQEKQCEKCGKMYKSNLNNTKYCSVECRVQANTEVFTVNRFSILTRDMFRCIYCGRSSIEDSASLEVDHIFPFSKGGKDTADNLVTSCSICNGQKGNTILDDEFLNRIKSIVIERNRLAEINNDRIMIVSTRKRSADQCL